MQYPNGMEVRLGDSVRLSNGEEAVVVFSIDTDEYSPGFPREEWQYLGNGVMVRASNGTLIHYGGRDENELMLVSREKET